MNVAPIASALSQPRIKTIAEIINVDCAGTWANTATLALGFVYVFVISSCLYLCLDFASSVFYGTSASSVIFHYQILVFSNMTRYVLLYWEIVYIYNLQSCRTM